MIFIMSDESGSVRQVGRCGTVAEAISQWNASVRHYGVPMRMHSLETTPGYLHLPDLTVVDLDLVNHQTGEIVAVMQRLVA